MKNLLILGAGTAGTMMAVHLKKKLDLKKWSIKIIDEHESHYYQPGFLFIPFGTYGSKDVIKKKSEFIPQGVELIQKSIDAIDKENNRVKLKDGSEVPYDILIIASGCKIVPSETEGMKEEGWYKNIFDFYTIEGALALHKALENFKGGDLVVHLNEMPIKCPVAPTEFSFLMDWWLHKKGIRDKTNLVYTTPLDSAFTKKNCADVLGYMLKDKKINLMPFFNTEKIDPKKNIISSFEGKEVHYDLLVTVPTNMGDPFVERSGFGDELNFVPTDKHTLQSKVKENIFVIGDATDVPASKAGSVAHFQAEVLTENILRYIDEKPLLKDFDGHANCFIESGFGKAFLIDFNYDLEPVTGKYPFPIIGPLNLLKETRLNHFGKMAFRWVYWNILLKARPIPFIKAKMSYAGKDISKELKEKIEQT